MEGVEARLDAEAKKNLRNQVRVNSANLFGSYSPSVWSQAPSAKRDGQARVIHTSNS